MSTTKIVFCDNDALSRETIKILLKKTLSVEIVGEFDNKDDLLNQLNEISPDIVIYDLHTNQRDDILTIQEILLINPALKVIVTSTFEDLKTIILAFTMGAIAILSKRRLTIRDLTNAITSSHHNTHYLSRSCEFKIENISKMIQLNYLHPSI